VHVRTLARHGDGRSVASAETPASFVSHRRGVVINQLTLDGVMQVPGRPEEDTRGGFELGGWAGPNVDGVVNAAMGP
jgi:hypothetical protein